MSSDKKSPIVDEEEPIEVVHINDAAGEGYSYHIRRAGTAGAAVEQVSGQAVEPALDSLLTKEMFSYQAHQLVQHARAAGLHPLRILLDSYKKRAATVFESLLDSLENEDVSKKKRKKK